MPSATSRARTSRSIQRPISIDVDRLTDRVVFRYEDEEAATYPMAPVPDNLDLRLTNEDLMQPLFSPMVRARKTVHPYPTVALGTVESNP